MVEPMNNVSNAYSVDVQERARAGVAADVQPNRQLTAATPEVQDQKKSSDTVTISREAVEAQRSTAVQTAPEQARVKAMEETQNTANRGTAANSPAAAVAQSYGVSQ
jgi:hypothetical protein